ncbi:MAG: hypothetical protein ABIL45_04425 [candidate division WOR-3 bacterium]
MIIHKKILKEQFSSIDDLSYKEDNIYIKSDTLSEIVLKKGTLYVYLVISYLSLQLLTSDKILTFKRNYFLYLSYLYYSKEKNCKRIKGYIFLYPQNLEFRKMETLCGKLEDFKNLLIEIKNLVIIFLSLTISLIINE